MEKPKYSDVYDFENLYQAARETIRNKKYYPEELRFAGNLEENLIEIQNELVWRTYKPGKYFEFYVYDPKKRLISAPDLKDRIVQSALCRVLERHIDPRLDFDSYACRNGKGTLRAAERAAYFARKYDYFAYFDIRKFFDSIPVRKLEEVYRKRFTSDSGILWLLHTIFMNGCDGRGIKKGCRTSQLSANVYLNELDHFARHTLKAKNHVRYMDDFMIFGNSAERLEEMKEEVRKFLWNKLFLELNEKTRIGETARGFEFVGYRIFKDYKIVRKLALKRSAAALRRWKKGKMSDDFFYRSAASRCGHMEGTASYKWMCGYLLEALEFALMDKK